MERQISVSVEETIKFLLLEIFYLMFDLVFDSRDVGLALNMPIISAGSFGLSCDFKADLTRILPPARKVSNFFINFWNFSDRIKPSWENTYIYKKANITEDCFW